jgi:hypothetical protein
MDNVTGAVIISAMWLGWIPILALCKGIAWIIEAWKSNESLEEMEK